MFRLKRGGDEVIRSTVVAGDTLVIRLGGELNLERTERARPKLLALAREHAPRRIVVSFADVPYLDSTALAALVELRNAMRSAKPPRELCLCELSPRLRELFRVARLDMIFKISDSEQEAVG